MRDIQIDGTPPAAAAPAKTVRRRRRVRFMARLARKYLHRQGGGGPSGFTKPPFCRVFLDFPGLRRFNHRNSRKDVLIDPPPGPGGRRSTPDSAMRPRAQKCLEYPS